MAPCTGVAALLVLATATRATTKKNIVYLVTDDQDQMLGSSFPETLGATPLAKTKALLVDRGVTFSNAFIHVPICNPSRSTTLTGKYFHNIKAVNTSWASMHVNMNLVHNHSFAVGFQAAGYRTALIGKYANAMPTYNVKKGNKTTAVNYVPQGWDTWLANDGGNYLNPQFVAQNAWNATDGTVQYNGSYTVAVVGNASVHFIEGAKSNPFFLYCAPKAVHEPFDPAPWYAGVWDQNWPDGPPRGPAWNMTFAQRENHAANIPSQPLLTQEAARVVDGIWRNRWRTLLSVDDVVEALVNAVDAAGALDDTYFFYTSDHGFQLGQLNMLMDKRHAYQWDTRIPLVVRGPGLSRSVVPQLATNVDLAPTFAALAGLPPNGSWDGRSLVDVLQGNASSWRSSVLVEYYYNDPNTKCVANCTPELAPYPERDSYCTEYDPDLYCWGPNGNGVNGSGGCDMDCYPTESSGNNFIALRKLGGGVDALYAKYETGFQTNATVNFTAPDAYELFYTDADPWCTTNAYAPENASALDAELDAWFACAGATCF